jgi:hypothetical protein
MKPGVGGAVSVKENDCIGLDKRSYVKDVDLEKRLMPTQAMFQCDQLTRMASLRINIVGTRFGTLESILRKSRGY